MCFVIFCQEEEKELGRQQAPGSCPYCGGKVLAIDFESQCRFCFLPLCYKIKKKYFCSLCSRRLELYH
ncbi:Methionyl-tRNA synthetase [Melia azedarach]|uniref:Methionyl-tRNA synthetase n=1 Tax=Melia azedarach TaxID=155640 RepID=A0ACC1XDE2_MELAZ|nr:Methionyl-tRNA synthetase [Melia azedarach]